MPGQHGPQPTQQLSWVPPQQPGPPPFGVPNTDDLASANPQRPRWYRRTGFVIVAAALLSLLVGIAIGDGGSSTQVSKIAKERDVAVAGQNRAEGAINDQVAARVVGATKARQSTLDNREKALNDRQTTLDNRERGLNDRQMALDGRQSALDSRETTLKNREDALSGRENAVSQAEATAKANTFPGTGTYLVGSDIQPGTYRAAASSGCYWERESGTGGSVGDIIANDNADGPVVITVRSSDAALKVSGCADFHKIS